MSDVSSVIPKHITYLSMYSIDTQDLDEHKSEEGQKKKKLTSPKIPFFVPFWHKCAGVSSFSIQYAQS